MKKIICFIIGHKLDNIGHDDYKFCNLCLCDKYYDNNNNNNNNWNKNLSNYYSNKIFYI